MFNNPELQRNLWLEFSRHRIVILPFVLLTILFTAYISDGYIIGKSVALTALWLYFLLAILWGSRLAGEAVTQEINDKTWSNQRMSSLQPWTMAWGKFCGCTLISWYGAIICLIVLMFAYPNEGWNRGPTLMYLIAICVLTALLVQLVSFIASLVAIRKSMLQNLSLHSRSLSILYVIFGLIFTGYMSAFTFNIGQQQVPWFGFIFGGHEFLLSSLVIFFIWAVVAAYRLMRLELQVKNMPIYWTLFVIFFAFYCAGFFAPIEHAYISKRLIAGYTVIALMTYLMMFSDTKDPMLFRRLFFNLSNKNYRKVFESIPAWFVTFVLLFIMMIILVWHSNQSFRFVDVNINFRFYVIATFLFAIRDIALILFFNFTIKRGKADMTAFLYLMLLYGLLPILFGVAKMPVAVAMFVPFGNEFHYVTIFSAASQAVVIAYFARRRWLKYFA